MENVIRKKQKFEVLAVSFSAIRLLPHIILFTTHPQKHIVKSDVLRWMKRKGFATDASSLYGFVYLMTFCQEFRHIFYKRIGSINRLIGWLCPRLHTPYISHISLDLGRKNR